MLTEYLMALAVIMSPPTEDATKHQFLARDIARVAIQLELLDERELVDIFGEEKWLTDEQSFNKFMSLIWNRRDQLKDCPPDSDRVVFVRLTNTTILEMLKFNQRYHQDLIDRQELTGKDDAVDAAIDETNELRRIYDKLEIATSSLYYVTTRREALKQVRDMIGEENYYNSLLPPPVPVWRIPHR